jgi:hypothetical protein
MSADVTAVAAEETRSAFRFAVGNGFEVRGVDEIGWLETGLGAETDTALGTLGNRIWIEPDRVDAAGAPGDQESGLGGDRDR